MKDALKPPDLSDSSVLFATFSLWTGGKRMPTNGSVEPFRDFLVPRVKSLDIIDQLVPGSESVLPKYERYRHKNAVPEHVRPPWWSRLMAPLLRRVNYNSTQILFKIRDFLSVADWVLTHGETYDYFVGLESVNAIAGILMRQLGRIKTVIYYVSDYSPNRYPNRFMNSVYLWLDRFAATHADFIWDVSLAMQKARLKAGLDASKSAPVIHVANGVFPDQIRVAKAKEIRPHALAYMGTVGPENGPDVAIGAVALLKKRFPDVTLDIIGGKPKDAEWLIPIIKKYSCGTSVRLHGFVPKSADMAAIMSICSVGLAPYRSFPGSARWYGDAGKIRAYCATGLPTVSSEVPPLGQEMVSYGAGVAVHDDPKSFAAAITRLFLEKDRYLSMRKKALAYAKNNTWDQQFSSAFTMMHAYEEKT
jgi:glycosyltransferase involved in cell wall biosynthesis